MKKLVVILLPLLLSGAIYADQIPKDFPGLVGLWHFNEALGVVCEDATGLGNHAILTNGALRVTGVNGRRVNTGASTRYVDVTNVTPINFEKTQPFSFGCIFKCDPTATLGGIIMLGHNQNAGNVGYWLDCTAVSAISRFMFSIGDGVTTLSQYRSDLNMKTYCDNREHSVIITYDGSNIFGSGQIYVDGVSGIMAKQGAGTTLLLTMQNNVHFQFGGLTSTLEWEGDLDEGFVANRCFTSGEATWLGKLMVGRQKMPLAGN